MTTLQIIDQIHEPILKNRRFSTLSIAEQLGITRERVGYIIHGVFHMRILSAKWVPYALTWIKYFNGPSRLRKIWNFLYAIQIISCRDCWPWTKHDYISMTRRKTNNKWSCGIAAHPAPKFPSAKNRLGKVSSRFLRSNAILLFDYLPKHQSIIADFHQGFLFLNENAPVHRAIATQKKLSYLGFQNLYHPPYSPDLAPSD